MHSDATVDIDDILNKMIKEEQLDYYNHAYYLQKDTAEQLINQLVASLPAEKGYIALRGAGVHTQMLIRSLNEANKAKIGFIIDREKPDRNKFAYPIIDVNQLEDKIQEISVVIISSFSSRRELIREIYNLKSHVKVIDLYSYFEVNGLYFTRPYYMRETLNHPVNIYNARCEMERSETEEEREISLSRLIFSCLCIRDFVNAKEYINDYINHNYIRTKQYCKFLNKLESLFHFIQNAMENRRQKDIVLQWIDNVGYCDKDKLPFLADKSEHSLFFENAFTVMPWTHFTLYTIFSGKKIIDDSLYTMSKVGEEKGEYPLWDSLKKDGYETYAIGRINVYVSKESNSYDEEGEGRLDFPMESVSYVQWEGIRSILKSEKKAFVLMHSIYELHDPYITCELDRIPDIKFNYKTEYEQNGDSYLDILDKNYLYVNKQLEWYSQFFSSNSTKIYFSDHGKYEKNHWKDTRTHTFLAVEDKAIEPKVCKELFSYLKFSELIKYIQRPDDENYKHMFSEYVELQCLDFYSEGAVNDMLNPQEEDEFSTWMQYMGIRSNDDKYIKYANGKEFYFLLPDENTNLIDQSEYREKINFYRTMISDKFVNVFRTEKFKLTRNLYQGIGLEEEIFINEKQL